MKRERNQALVALGQQIRKVRKEKGVSQEGFAATVGLNRSYYGCVERGERNVAALNMMRIAAALGVGVGELFPEDKDLRRLLDAASVDVSHEE